MDIHPIFESKIRLAIIGCLLKEPQSFSSLRELTGATDGNLITHLARLEKSKFVKCKKATKNKKVQSIYSLTTLGKDEFVSYVHQLNELLGEEFVPASVEEIEDKVIVPQNVGISEEEIWL